MVTLIADWNLMRKMLETSMPIRINMRSQHRLLAVDSGTRKIKKSGACNKLVLLLYYFKAISYAREKW